MFRTRSSSPFKNRRTIVCGRAAEFTEKVVDGVSCLVESGFTNITAYVESVFDETLVYNLIDRFNRGDSSALGSCRGLYGDFVNVPSDLIESFNMIKRVDSDFNKLPTDVKAHYGNSVYKFAAALDSGEFKRFMQSKQNTTTTGADQNKQAVQKED